MCSNSETSQTLPAIVHVVGVSNAGKTTLIERLLPYLRARGARVGTVKHAHHSFEMDHPGKDSWRHAQAGSEAVAVIGPQRAAWLLRTADELSAEQAMAPMAGRVDLVLVEGFKSDPAEPLIRLEPDASTRLQLEGGVCRVGVFPAALELEELEQIAAFCLCRRPEEPDAIRR